MEELRRIEMDKFLWENNDLIKCLEVLTGNPIRIRR